MPCPAIEAAEPDQRRVVKAAKISYPLCGNVDTQHDLIRLQPCAPTMTAGTDKIEATFCELARSASLLEVFGSLSCTGACAFDLGTLLVDLNTIVRACVYADRHISWIVDFSKHL